jgi:hypothetical protein
MLIVQLEGLSKLKNPVASLEIEPATFRLNQIRYRVPQRTHKRILTNSIINYRAEMSRYSDWRLAGRPGFNLRQRFGFFSGWLWDSSVGIVAGYRLDDPGWPGFSLLHSLQSGALAHPASCPVGTGCRTAGALSRPLTSI